MRDELFKRVTSKAYLYQPIIFFKHLNDVSSQGFTMFGQRRIEEHLYGRAWMCLEAKTGQALLRRHLEEEGDVSSKKHIFYLYCIVTSWISSVKLYVDLWKKTLISYSYRKKTPISKDVPSMYVLY